MEQHHFSIVITDDRKRLWKWIDNTLHELGIRKFRLPSTFRVPESEDLIEKSPYLFIHWESNRLGGSLIEEILEQHPHQDLDQIIVLTTSPTKEDVIYFSELCLKNIIHIRWLDTHLLHAKKQISKIINKHNDQQNPYDQNLLQKIKKHFQNPKKENTDTLLLDLEDKLLQSSPKQTASVLDFKACEMWLKEQPLEAYEAWEKAHEQNPQYPHTLEHQFLAFKQKCNYKMARHTLKKLHQLNKNKASRWLDLGSTHLEQENLQKAEGCFLEAMQRDPHNQKFALTFANLKFLEGEYEVAKKFAAKATSTQELASLLNSQGIQMVRRGEYEAATKHYEKALLVLKNDQKSASIFYNLSLCLYRQGHYEDAAALAQVSLIKEPDHTKALRLLSNLRTTSP
ncbi:MAG: tetratricopeptide repeat protein [Oligoflexales bacterium]